MKVSRPLWQYNEADLAGMEGQLAKTLRDSRKNILPLQLHIPEPKCRPGDAPDFATFRVSSLWADLCPPFNAPASATHPLANDLIRVLDESGHARGSWKRSLDTDSLLRGLRAMMLTRIYDDRMFRAQRQGKTSFYMKCTGEEAIAVAQAVAVDDADMVFPSYRQQGMLIARGCPLVDMMCQIYSNTGDHTLGRQLPVFYSSRDCNFFSISGNLGTQFSQAVGWAMASAYKGDSRIAVTYTGEGATAEGDFHYAMTMAAVYRAPVILNIVNNQWAISSFQGIAGGDEATFATRALGYGLPCLRVDGNDFLAVYAATLWASERARANLGATVIEHVTYRVAPHSTSDDPVKYRPADEAQQWPLGDPIARLKHHLIVSGVWSEEQNSALVEDLTTQVAAAAKESESYGTLTGDGPAHSPNTMFTDVFKEMPWHLREQLQEMENLQ